LALAPLESAQRAIDATAQRMANGELDARLDTSGHAGVADAVNRMADRLADRLQAQRSLLQAVSHELRTPVSRLRLSAGLVQRVKTEEARARHLASFDAELQALDDLIEELMTFVRMEQVSVDAAPWPLEDALIAIAEDARLEIADGLPTPPLPRKLFERAVSNLVRNAQRHARQTVRVRATLSKGLCISVDDDGDGIPEADRARVLEPFVHLSPGGHGLGLAISQRIATRSGGSLHLSSSDLGGCRAELRWPLGTSS
jgi:signal transduction histidine kinase